MKIKLLQAVIFCFFYLTGLSQINLVKGPYLQLGTPNSVIIKWETTVPCDSKIQWGAGTNSLTSAIASASNVTSHEVQITGLSAYTKYYYSVGTSSLVLQGDSNNYFVTSPLPGAPGKYRFWVTGDCGNASTNQINVRDQYLNYNAGKRTDGWILLGDNAYFYGSHADYNAEFFGIYQGSIMKKAVIWPAPGNHDYNNGATTSQTVPYYDIFTTPDNAQAGGISSGTEAYYSFNYGNIHFVSLDSYGTFGAAQKMYDTLGPQAIWLKQDLAANTQQWTIAYWHHPPYTMGSHNSDTETDLVSIRQNFIRILERYHVDLIMCGHSHDYERSKLMKGNYGSETTFSPSQHLLDTSTALYDGSLNSCPYIKDTTNKKAGTVYVVAGSAGYLGGQQASFPHDAMYYSNATDGGSLVLDIEQNKLEAKWLCADGVIRDKFTIYKHVNKVTSYTVNPGQSFSLSASWPGTYVWSNSFSLNPATVSTFSNTSFWVKDSYNCVADTFHIKVLPAVSFSNSGSYCAGQTLQFNDNSSNNPINWQWTVSPSLAVNISSASVPNPQINFSAPMLYTVSLVAGNAFGQGSVSSQTVLIHPQPFVLYSNSSNNLCLGETVTLTATGSPAYIWSNGQTGSNIIVSPTLSTAYTTTFISSFGCTNTGTVNLLVDVCASISQTFLAGKDYSVLCDALTNDISVKLEISGNFQLQLHDLCGRLVGTQILVYGINPIKQDLVPGIYVYKIYSNAVLLGSGKLLKN
ncbi:MAG: metallophosphoesterase [Bacteroidia bacterium]|nr:metallophosphoesterase [Bacteroidia bacterium]